MDLSTAMRFVMMRAQGEATACGMELYPEHLFLGLLKLSEVTANAVAPNSRHKQEMDQDIKLVSAHLEALGIDSGAARKKLRRMFRNEVLAGNGESAIANILAKAAAMGDGNIVTSSNVLFVLTNEPTPLLAVFSPLSPQHPVSPMDDEQNPEQKQANIDFGITYLPKLTDRIRHLRYALLDKVYGQDHVIHAFAEGMFHAEVLAAADDARKKPRAIFVFIGPQGVGKTFLAEQAAQILAIPFKRFDMNNYTDHQSHTILNGLASGYKESNPGQLTGFVKDNPHCILLFDEIEKAHQNTIQVFLKILEEGILYDHCTEQTVSFKDTIIIFTTNAGKQLYEGDYKANAAVITRQTILKALETDTHPQTGKPFFPVAICPHLSTSYPMIFNHLQAHDLEKISTGEFIRFCSQFEKQYNIKVAADRLLSTILLFAEGGLVNARTLRAQTELFFKNEIFKLCQLWGDNINVALKKLKSIKFEVKTEKLSADVISLFHNPEPAEILFFGDVRLAEKIRLQTTNMIIHHTKTIDDALKILSDRNICFVLLELFTDQHTDTNSIDIHSGKDENIPNTNTMYSFDHVPIASSSIQESRIFFKLLRERITDVPIYLLESEKFKIDRELLTSFVRAGIQGKLSFSSGENSVFVEEITDICTQVYMQTIATGLAAQHKSLTFESAPKLSSDQTQAFIRLRDFAVR